MKFSNRLKQLLKNEKGIALIVVLTAFVVSTIVGASLLGLTTNNVKMSTGERNYQATFYIAESGVNYSMNEIAEVVMEEYQNAASEEDFFTRVEAEIGIGSENVFNEFEEHFGQQPEARIVIEKLNSNIPTRQYRIVSEAFIGNRTRMVEKNFAITWIPKNNLEIPRHTAIFVNSTITLSGGARISGGAGTNSSKNNAISLSGGTDITGEIFVGPYAGNRVLDIPDYINVSKPTKLTAVKNFAIPEFPNFPSYPYPANERVYNGSSSYQVIFNGDLRIDNWMTDGYTLNLNRDVAFSTINITQGNRLNIDVGAEDRSIVVGNLYVPNGEVRIVGGGKLTIYVTGTMTMGSGGVINSGGNTKQLEMYLKGTGVPLFPKNLNLSGGQRIYGSLFAEDADLSFSGGAGFQGHIVTGGKNVSLSGGVYTNANLFYAPSADVHLSGGATVKGSVVANSFTASGGSKVTRYDVEEDELPFFQTGGGDEVQIEDILEEEPVRERE